MTLTFLRWALALWPDRLRGARDAEARPRDPAAALAVRRRDGRARLHRLQRAVLCRRALTPARSTCRIIQGAVPALVLIGARFVLGVRVTGLQAFGASLTMLGVAAIAAQGDWSRLADARVQQRRRADAGRLRVLCRLYAGLRDRPAVSGFGFLAAMALRGADDLVPLFISRSRTASSSGRPGKGLAAAGLRGARARLLAQLLYMRGVELIGPGPRGRVRQSRAGVRRGDGGRLARRAVRRLPCGRAGARRWRHRHRAAQVGLTASA